jgi:pimeloyl-ACP methyl ester carboxylesterase
MSAALIYLLVMVFLLGTLVAATSLGVARLEAAHPPAGKFVDVQGVKIHVAELGLARGAPGADPAIVLLHGASGNMEDMRLALGDVLGSTHRVILIDRPGHGWSARPRHVDYASPARQAELVADVLNYLGVKRAIVIGHSWGGACATAYALTFPQRTASLVLIAAPCHPWDGDCAKLIVLKNIGHMPHYAAPKVVAAAVDELKFLGQH